jgi:uncharacterized protein DUF3883
MPSALKQIAANDSRTKQIIAGLFLSRFDKAGLHSLGFSSFAEAFNAIGLALGAKPASIKNYRDEFDPIYSAKRKGWRNRTTRAYCKEASEKYETLSLVEFATVLKSLIYERGEIDLLAERADEELTSGSSFAKRLETGQAAEKYFETVQPSLPRLGEYSLENVTNSGCGFDYKLSKKSADNFLAVEVKGLNESRGILSLTEKEHRVAGLLTERFYLFVVRNFRKTPSHSIYCNPLDGRLSFVRQVKQVEQVSWRLVV